MSQYYPNDRQTLKMRELIKELNSATEAYDRGHPIMSDEEWDNLYFQLIEAERQAGFTLLESPTQTISYKVVTELQKVQHNHKMLSLDKTKEISEVDAFLGNNAVLAMCKMDGLTCSLRYVDGILVSAETRGNGIEGEDILHNARVIPTIPKYISYLDELIVDGEIICPYDKFEQFAQDYKNPRNFAAGSIRLLDSRECELRNLKFIAWDVIKGLDKHISHFYDTEDGTVESDETVWFQGPINEGLVDKLYDLGKLGFTIVPNIVDYYNHQNYGEKIAALKKTAEEFHYPIDGIVFKFNNIEYGKSLGETAHHFKNAIAYKFYDETYPTKVLDVVWSMGRTGVLTPIAIFEPVDIEGAIITRASLHNYGIMLNELHLTHYGQKVEIFRANMIIPQIDKVYPPEEGMPALQIPKFCPYCGAELKVKDNCGVLNLVCDNSECSAQIINRLDHFVGKKGLDIKGLSKATLEKLIDWGYINNLVDIFKLSNHAQDWKKQEGFGEKSVQKILDAIEKAKCCTLESFISALGIPLIGLTNAHDIALQANGSYETFRDMIKNNYNFAQLSNFGEAKCDAIIKFDYSEADDIINYLHIIEKNDILNNIEKTLQDKTFVITGKLLHYKNRELLEKEIENRGGKVAKSVSSKTDYLVNNDINSTSTKNITAKKLGIPIITEDELIQMF